MPINRKHQIAAKIETAEGVDAWGGSAPDAADVVRVNDPTVQDAQEQDDSTPSGASLSKDFTSPGRATRSMTFGADFVGNTTGADDDARRNAVPPWDGFVRACGTKRVSLAAATGTVSSGPFFVGERVGSTVWSGGTPAVWGLAANDGVGGLYIVPIVGSWTGITTVFGEQSLATIGTATLDVTGGLAYLPDTQQTVSVDLTVGGWSGAAPSAGDVILIYRSGSQVGSAVVITAGDPIVLSVLYRNVQDGDTLTTATGSTATVEASGAVTALNSPSISVYSNLDGEERRLLGGRGDFTLGGETGKPLKFAFTLGGSPTTAVDALQVAGVSLATLSAPKFAGAIFGMGYDRDATIAVPTGTPDYVDTCVPAKSIELATGNTNEDRRDHCAASGILSSRVTDRDPQITVEFEKVGVHAFNWGQLRTLGTPLRIGFVIGTVAGNRVGFVANRCQVLETSDGEADGLATVQVTLALRRIREAGDDEFAITKF